MSLGGLDGILGLGPLLGPQPSSTLITNLIPSTSASILSSESTIIHESTTSLITTPTPTSSSVTQSLVSSTIVDALSNASTATSTIVATESAPALSTAQPSHHAQPQGFLQNKTLSGFVFVLCGLAGLVLITMIGTWAVRRREKRRIMDEAMIFDSASMIADPHNHNDSSKLESGIPSRRGRGISRSISKRSYKRMSDESFGHVSQGPSGYGGVLPGGDYAGYGIPTLAYASPSTIIQPQYPQAMHVDRQRTYEDDNQPPYYHYGTAS